MKNILDTKISDLRGKGLLVEEISRQDAESVAGGSSNHFAYDFDAIWLANPKIAKFFGFDTGNNGKDNPQRTVKEYRSPDGKIYNYEVTESYYDRDYKVL